MIFLRFESASPVYIEVEKQNVLVMAHETNMRARVESHSGVNCLAVAPAVDVMFDRLPTTNEGYMTVFVGCKTGCRSRDGSLGRDLSGWDKYTLVYKGNG